MSDSTSTCFTVFVAALIVLFFTMKMPFGRPAMTYGSADSSPCSAKKTDATTSARVADAAQDDGDAPPAATTGSGPVSGSGHADLDLVGDVKETKHLWEDFWSGSPYAAPPKIEDINRARDSVLPQMMTEVSDGRTIGMKVAVPFGCADPIKPAPKCAKDWFNSAHWSNIPTTMERELECSS